jgi:hypothetical protein
MPLISLGACKVLWGLGRRTRATRATRVPSAEAYATEMLRVNHGARADVAPATMPPHPRNGDLEVREPCAVLHARKSIGPGDLTVWVNGL